MHSKIFIVGLTAVAEARNIAMGKKKLQGLMELILYKKEMRQKPNQYLVLCKEPVKYF